MKKNKILVSDLFDAPQIIPDNLELLVKPDLCTQRTDLLREISDCDGLIVRNITQVDAEVYAAAKKLKIIGRLGVGLDNINLELAHTKGIKVVYTPTANSEAVAEYCLCQLLNLFRLLPQAHLSTAKGQWNRKQFLGKEIKGSTVGIIGYGNSGACFAQKLQALGARVLINTPRPEKVPDRFKCVSFSALIKQADAISIHTPLTNKTRGLFGIDEFKQMKSHAVLINASRGEILKENELIDALKDNLIAGIAMDVRESEPPTIGFLENHDKVILSPHIAAFTHEAQDRVTQSVLEDLSFYFSGQEPKWLVN